MMREAGASRQGAVHTCTIRVAILRSQQGASDRAKADSRDDQPLLNSGCEIAPDLGLPATASGCCSTWSTHGQEHTCLADELSLLRLSDRTRSGTTRSTLTSLTACYSWCMLLMMDMLLNALNR